VRESYRAIYAERNHFPLQLMFRLMEVSKSGYFSWLRMRYDRSGRAQRRDRLDHLIRVLFVESGGNFGSPKIYNGLLSLGIKISLNTVARRMRELGFSAVPKKRPPVKTTHSNHRLPTCENILNRDFDVHSDRPAWVSDITYIHTRHKQIYLATMIDLRTRKVIGWAVDDHMRKELVINAFNMALSKARRTEGVIVHSDRGSQYCSREFTQLLKAHGMIQSMSAPGECLDNAVAESFFGHLKRELGVRNLSRLSISEAKRKIANYMHWYNSERFHSTLNYMTPIDFESQLRVNQLQSP